jgi:serine/threonine protein kinase
MKPATHAVLSSPFDEGGAVGCLADYSVPDAATPVGRGRFSEVFYATRRRDSLPCALKKISWSTNATGGSSTSGGGGSGNGSKPEATATKCLKEVGLLRSLTHENVVRYLDSFIQVRIHTVIVRII